LVSRLLSPFRNVREFFRYRPSIHPSELTAADRQDSLRKLVIAWCLGTVFFEGISGAPLVGMFRRLGATPFWIGLLVAIPSLSTIMQPAGAYVVARTGSRKRMLIHTAIPGRLTWLVIPTLGFFFPHNYLVLGLMFSLVLFSRLTISFSSPAWFSWVSDLVPEDERGSFWGSRQMWARIFGISAAIMLGWFLGTEPPYYKFIVFFCLMGFIGWLEIFIHRGVMGIRIPVPTDPPTMAALVLRPLRDKRFLPIIIFTFSINFATQIGGGMFSLMMLEEIKFSYFEISVFQVGILGLVTVLSSRYVGRVMDNLREGARLVFYFGAIVTSLQALPWAAIPARAFLPVAGTVILGGIGWAAYHIALTGLLMGYSPRDARATYSAMYAVISGIGSALGAIAGGSIAEALQGISYEWGPFILTPLRTLYLISFGGRILALFLLPMIREPGSIPMGVYVRQLLSLNPFDRDTYIYIKRKLSPPTSNGRNDSSQH
jgi:MFS family permease